MASSGNFCTLNPLDFQGSISNFLSNGNLKASTGANLDAHCHGTFGINADTDTQGYYYEVRIESRSNNQAVGWSRNIYYTGSYGASSGRQSYVMANGQGSGAGDVYTLNSVNTSFRQTFSNGDIVGVAIKGGKIWFAKNNTYINSGNPAGDSGEAITGATGTLVPVWYVAGGGTNTQYFNFGQDDTFGGAITGEGNTDENGFGLFKYAPPTGFLALCSANLPISDDIDPAQTDDNFPGKQCGVVTYTGNQPTGQTVSGLGFKPDLIWAKMRSSTQDNQLYNSQVLNSRNTPFMLRSNSTGAEIDDQAQGNNNEIISSFDTDGFTLGGSNSGPNDASRTYVAWCWKANGGTTASNSNGAISSTVQANQAAGFSIVQWTANATSSVATTVGHGLSKAPEFVITKSRESATNWCVTHTGLSSTSHMLFLNSNATETDKSGNGNMSANTSTVFSVNATDGSNAPNGDNMIAYCWHSVEGYSKFGKYEGNANTDGVFVYTGFRPRILIIRVLNVASDGWLMYDTERETFNPLDTILKPHSDAAEYSNAAFTLDIVSNGFKLRSSDNAVNGTSYDPYIYMAWGDAPFKYNNTF